MNKLLALLVAVVFALAALPSDAEARHGHGFFRVMRRLAFHHHHHHHPHFFPRFRRRVVVVHEAPQPRVIERVVTRPAVVEPEPEAEPEVETANVVRENSSIATSDDTAEAEPEAKPVRKVAKAKVKTQETADSDDNEEVGTPVKSKRKVAAAGELGCKSFFPSVGMTLSVPCD